MRTKPRLTLEKLQRRNPSVSTGLTTLVTGGFLATARRRGKLIASARGRSPEEAWYWLGDRLLKLAGREAMARAGWRDANTGKVEPLSGHHVVKRSKSRNDSAENLAALGLESHTAQHEQSLSQRNAAEADKGRR